MWGVGLHLREELPSAPTKGLGSGSKGDAGHFGHPFTVLVKTLQPVSPQTQAAAESAEAQTIRSVQQTLASTNLTSSLLLSPPLSQHGAAPASAQTLQPSLPRSIAPKPLTMRLPVNPMVTSVSIAASMPSNLGAPLMSSMVGSAPSAQASPSVQTPPPPLQQLHFQHHLQLQQHISQQHLQQRLQLQHQPQPSPRQHSPVASQIASPIPTLGSPQPASQQHPPPQIQPQTQTQVLSQVSIF